MQPISSDQLRFFATQESIEEPGEPEAPSRTIERLQLELWVEEGETLTTLVTILIEDSESIGPDDPLPFHYWYTPLEILWDHGKSEKTTHPQIDLIVYASTRVRVLRNLAEMKRLESIGMQDVFIEPDEDDRIFSPFRPKITLRRVQHRKQVPRPGSKSDLKVKLPDYSLFVDEKDELQLTKTASPVEYLRRRRREPGLPDSKDTTWVRVAHAGHYTAYDHPFTGFRLYVYDQLFDSFDGKTVEHFGIVRDEDNQISVDEAMERTHTAGELIAHPRKLARRYFVELGTPAEDVIEPAGTVRFTRVGIAILLDPRNPVPVVGAGSTKTMSGAPAPAFSFWIGDQPIPLNLAQTPDQQPRGIIYSHKSSFSQIFAEFGFSLAVGFTPIAGEAFDLYELYTAFRYGEDAFGSRLSDTEKVITAVAVIVPFVGAGALRKGISTLPKRLFPHLKKFAEEQRMLLNEVTTLIDT